MSPATPLEDADDEPAVLPAPSLEHTDAESDSADFDPPMPEKLPMARPQASSATTVRAAVEPSKRALRSSAPPCPPEDQPPCPPPLPPCFIDNVSWIITGAAPPEPMTLLEIRRHHNRQRNLDSLDRPRTVPTAHLKEEDALSECTQT